MRTQRQEAGPTGLARNYLQGCVLLLVAESPTHGYELLDQLSELGLSHVDSGVLYRALRSLNEDGLVESWWEESGSGPVRRRYRISADGLSCLEAWAASVGDSASLLSSFVARHRRLRAVSGVGA